MQPKLHCLDPLPPRIRLDTGATLATWASPLPGDLLSTSRLGSAQHMSPSSMDTAPPAAQRPSPSHLEPRRQALCKKMQCASKRPADLEQARCPTAPAGTHSFLAHLPPVSALKASCTGLSVGCSSWTSGSSRQARVWGLLAKPCGVHFSSRFHLSALPGHMAKQTASS